MPAHPIIQSILDDFTGSPARLDALRQPADPELMVALRIRQIGETLTQVERDLDAVFSSATGDQLASLNTLNVESGLHVLSGRKLVEWADEQAAT